MLPCLPRGQFDPKFVAIPPSTIVRMPLRRSWRSSSEGAPLPFGDADIARFCEAAAQVAPAPTGNPPAGSGVG